LRDIGYHTISYDFGAFDGQTEARSDGAEDQEEAVPAGAPAQVGEASAQDQPLPPMGRGVIDIRL